MAIKIEKSQLHILRTAAFLFFAVSVILVVTDEVALHMVPSAWQRVVDDLLGGLIAAAIFYWYERRRLKKLAQTLRVIDLTNHHIRNALQPLMFVGAEGGNHAQMRIVEDCVRRVDWTLREVLPGRSSRSFPSHDGGFGESRPRPTETEHDRLSRLEQKPQKPSGSEPFFSHWIDSWKDRNLGAGQ